MYLKIHESCRKVVALADATLIGKKLEDEKRQLEVRENFFKGNTIEDEEKIIQLLKNLKADDATFNIVGKKAVQTAIRAGIINKEHTAKVQGIPFALVLL